MNPGFLISNVLVAIAYFLAVQAGELLVVLPANTAAIWPAAGVATAAAIILGPRVLPGIFIVGIFSHGHAISETMGGGVVDHSLLTLLLTSLAVVVQAWIGAVLANKVLVHDHALLSEKTIAKFCIFVGLLSTVTAASLCTVILWFQGLLSLANLPLIWIIWWISDALGVLIFCPLLLCFFGKPRHLWRTRIISVAIPLCLVISVVFIIFRVSYLQELKRIEAEFDKNARQFKSELTSAINSHAWSSEDLKTYIDSSESVTRNEFYRYIQPKLLRYQNIKALEWIPRIAHQNRQAFEDRIGRPISVPNQMGLMDIAPVKDFYYPVEFVEPSADNEKALGFDVTSNPIAAQAAAIACLSGKMAVTDGIKLVQESTSHVSVVFYNPVYAKNERGNALIGCQYMLGLTASVFQLEYTIEKIHKNFPELHIVASLNDASGLLYSDVSLEDETITMLSDAEFKYSDNISVANQQWQLSIVAVKGFRSFYATWSVWITLAGGLFFSALFGIGLLMLTGRNLLTEEKITQRTIELNDEVNNRKAVATMLAVENNSLEMITEDASTSQIFDSITTGIETIIPDARSSILLMTADGKHLTHGSAPRLPAEYIEAINGVAIGPNVGSCGTAAYLNKQIIVSDIATDPLWTDYKELALKHGLKACFSFPITVSDEKVLGAFALYFNAPKEPDLGLLELAQRMANIAAIAILRRQSEEQLVFNASHDALTKLVNRREFERRAERLLDLVKLDKQPHALCFMDLDQFKIVNDSCGHAAGDEMLRQITTAIQQVVRKRDTLARMGGDEFSVLMECCSLEHAQRLADDLYRVIQDYVFLWEGQSFRVGVSIGLVAITEAVPNLTELLKEADAACYMAKDSGRNRIHIYQPEDAETAQRHSEMRWVSKINQALEEHRFCLYAQAIEPLDNSSEIHYELLIRMLDENQEIIPPGAFLSAAERYNIITKIDLWVINQAFNLLVNNPIFVEAVSFISINLSGQSLADSNVLNFIKKQLGKTGVDGKKICFEITETAAISHMGMATQLISTLKQLGCRFALDDFGSGLSSFGYLKRLPVDYLKIDGMFVKDIIDDPIDRAMAKSINEIGQIMGMKTIAEFVENDEIKDMLREIGVDYAQGYGIAKPLLFDDLLKTFK